MELSTLSSCCPMDLMNLMNLIRICGYLLEIAQINFCIKQNGIQSLSISYSGCIFLCWFCCSFFHAFVPVHIWICVLAKMEILELVRFVLSLLMCFFVYYIYIYSDGILRPGSYRIFPVIRKTTRSTQKHIKMCVD